MSPVMESLPALHLAGGRKQGRWIPCESGGTGILPKGRTSYAGVFDHEM